MCATLGIGLRRNVLDLPLRHSFFLARRMVSWLRLDDRQLDDPAANSRNDQLA